MCVYVNMCNISFFNTAVRNRSQSKSFSVTVLPLVVVGVLNTVQVF